MRHCRLTNIVWLCIALGLGTHVCGEEAQTSKAWTDKPILESPGDFHFAIIADNTGGPRPGVLADGVAKVNLLRPAFVMTIGDLVEGYQQDKAAIEAEWEKLSGIIEPLEMRLFFLPGNHEASNKAMSDDYARRMGGLYYHFVYRNVLFLCLNSQDGEYVGGSYPSAVSDTQVEYVRKVLDENRDVRWTLVFIHQPLWDTHRYNDPGWQKVQRLLSERPHTVFAGHYHRYGKHEIDGNSYIRLATTGGSSGLSGAEQGEFDHITWVTMGETGPVIVNLSLDGIHREDVSTDLSERAYWSVNWRWPVLAFSIVTENLTVTNAVIPIQFTNITDVPMTAHVRIAPPGKFLASPDTIDVTLDPGGEKTVEVAVRSQDPVAVEDMDEILVDWEVAYPIPGRETVRGQRTQKVIVEPIHKAAKTAGPVSVDGDLGEWSTLPFVVDESTEISRDHRKPWYGAGDASLKFGVARDEESLYIAVEAVDDRIVFSEEEPYWRRDGLSVMIDPRDRTARREPDNARTLSLQAGPGGGEGPPGVAVACLRTEKGYNIEIAVPLSFLVEKLGGELRDFRLNLRMRDRDEADGAANDIWWRPGWNDPYSYVDSGTFRLE